MDKRDFQVSVLKCNSTSAWMQDGMLFVNWSGNLGWGQLTFSFDSERHKLVCNSEFMGKESVAEILRQLVEDSVVLSDVKIDDELGRWVKKVRILDELEAGAVFSMILQKQLGSRTFTRFHRELQIFEDRWEDDGKVFCVYSHETQNTALDEDVRWMDIDTFKVTANDDDHITIITGFTRIEEWSWVVEPINKEEE